MNKLLHYNNRYYSLYLFLLLFFYISRNEFFPIWHDVFLQLFMLFSSYCIIRGFLNGIAAPNIGIYIFIYQLLCSFLMQYFNYEIYGDLYGFNPIDAEAYRSYAFLHHKDFADFLFYLKYKGNLIDDYGYPLIIYFASVVTGKYYIQSIVVLNAIVVAIGSQLLSKISSLFVSKQYSILVGIIWGIMPFAVYTTAGGLKENFFVFFIILSFYFLYKYIQEKWWPQFLFCLLFASTIFLFRLALGYAMLLSIFSYFLFKSRFVQSHYKFILFTTLITILISFSYVATYLIVQRGYDYDTMTGHAKEKIGGLVGTVTNYVAGFIGPIPNFVSTSPEKLTYITRYSFTPYIKMMISFYFWYAIYYVIKNKKIEFFPIITFYIINTIMLLFTFFTLHDRYQWPHIPVFILLSIYGYMQTRHKVKIKRLYSWYVCLIVMIIIVFNFR